MSKRAWLAAAGVVATVVLIGGGWLAAQAFTSPAQWEAQASPPTSQPVLATVERGDLIASRTLPGMVAAQSEESVALLPMVNAARSVVTNSPLSPGASVNVGEPVAWVNGFPVFAITSPFPFYRDLGVGDSGPDVRILQENLTKLGLLGAADGDFGAATARAVSSLYKQVGVPVPLRVAEVGATPVTNAPGSATEKSADSAIPSPVIENPFLPLSAVVTFASLPAEAGVTPSVGVDVVTGASIGVVSARQIVRVSVPADAKSALAVGGKVKFTVAGQQATEGVVVRVFDATADKAAVRSGSEVITWADIAPPGDAEIGIAGTTASISIDTRQIASGALLVPTASVARQGGSKGIVLRRATDGTFLEVRVTVLGSVDGRSAIQGDLQPGDQIRVD